MPAFASAYLELVARTSRVTVKGSTRCLGNCVAGFWHTDSCTMNLLLRQMKPLDTRFTVITTMDKRGDCIEQVMGRYGAKSLRLPDGVKIKGFLTQLKQHCKEAENLCIALDGPLGPLKQPKKLGFLLASQAEKNMVVISVRYSAKISLQRRWDHYVIPLPFTRIEFTLHDLGHISKAELREFGALKEKVAAL